jgi:hypothetical protein
VSDEQTEHTGRAAFAISQLYYYVAAVIGVGFLVGGGIAMLSGVRHLILPRPYDTNREAVRQILHGAAFALPGGAALWWHLREAARRERHPYPAVFWGRAVYFFLVALVSLAFVMAGAGTTLAAAADAAVPICFVPPGLPVPGPVPFFGPISSGTVGGPSPPAGGGSTGGGAPALPATGVPPLGSPPPIGVPYVPVGACSREDAANRAGDGATVLIVALPVWLVHLRLGRRITPAPPSSPAPAAGA